MLSEIASAGKKLPKGFYSHNLKILGLFLFPAIVLFLFGEMIADGLGKLLKIIGIWLFHLIRNVILLIFGESLFPAVMSMPNETPQVTNNPILTGIISTAVVGFLLYFLIKFRGEILDALEMFFSHLFDSVRRLIFAKAPVMKESAQGEYIDSVELLESDSTKIYHAPRKISWKYQYRKFRKLSPSSENYRVGYALWLDALKHWKAEFTEKDTPAQILRKSGGIPEPELTKIVTEIYYAVRYGNHTPTQTEWNSLCQLLEEVRKHLS